MEAKSVITFPSGGQTLAGPGLYELTGLAWSGRGKIERVEIGVAQTYEGLAQVLCCVSGAFALALAGPVVKIIVLLFTRRHRVSYARALPAHVDPG